MVRVPDKFYSVFRNYTRNFTRDCLILSILMLAVVNYFKKSKYKDSAVVFKFPYSKSKEGDKNDIWITLKEIIPNHTYKITDIHIPEFLNIYIIV